MGWSASYAISVDSTLTVRDVEVPLEAPVWSPAVCNNPVVDTALAAPSDDLHGMAAKCTAGDVLIYSALVVHEVLVDCEPGFDGSVVDDGELDCVRIVVAVD
jgi:hypothetical protein